MKLRRGFLKEAEDISLSFRQEMGVLTSQPLCAFELCDFLGIPFRAVSTISDLNNEWMSVLKSAPGVDTKFFATTIKPNGIPEILYNDIVSLVRQQSDMCHEVAHIVLGHQPQALMGNDGCRNYDRVMEREAHELGYNILVPKPSALFAVENFPTRQITARHFGVSLPLLEYRIRKTNADGWARSRRNKRLSYSN